MDIFSLITEEENEAIDWYRREYVNAQNLEKYASNKHILRYWVEAKKKLCRMFGNKLILEKEIDYRLDENAIWKELSTLVENDEFARKVRITENMPASVWRLFCVDNLFDNLYIHYVEPINIELPNGKMLKIRSGCKIMRICQKIANAFGWTKEYEEFRRRHSMILNQKRIKGTLCLSIHPLDYMTMSDNNSNWESCMSWTELGEYRQGTVEMMNSPYVIVAYVKSDNNPYMIDSFAWNNKKWRKLFIITKEVIVGVKDYPYENEDISNAALDWLKELAETNLEWEYHNKRGILACNHSDIVEAANLRFYTDYMYNDFSSSPREHYIGADVEYGECIHINFSGESECMICGSPYIETADSLACLDCYHMLKCCECGEYYNTNDLLEEEGSYYCRDCYDNCFSYCKECGKFHYNDNFYSIDLIDDTREENYAIDSIVVCNSCYRNLIPKPQPRIMVKYGPDSPFSLYCYNYIKYSEASEEVLKKFNFDKDEDGNIIY